MNRTVRYLLGIWLTFLSAGGIAVARATDAPPACAVDSVASDRGVVTPSVVTLAEAEADLRALGLHSIGVTAGIRHMEVFANDWNEQAYLYYAVPMNVVPYVLSIHIVGEKAPKKHLSKYSHELIVHFRSQMDILLLNVMARSAK